MLGNFFRVILFNLKKRPFGFGSYNAKKNNEATQEHGEGKFISKKENRQGTSKNRFQTEKNRRMRRTGMLLSHILPKKSQKSTKYTEINTT